MRKIVMFSGGYDSTGYLCHYLLNTNYKIHAHHISIINTGMRHKAEMAAVTEICRLAKRIRNFKLTTSTWDYDATSFLGWDIATAAYVGSIIAMDYWYKNSTQKSDVCIGISFDDMSLASVRTPLETRQMKVRFMFNGLMANIPEEFRPELTWDLSRLHKKDLVALIPDEIKSHVWTCRTPINTYSKCGKCYACNVERNL